MTKWASDKLDYLNFFYGKEYDKWAKESHNDDRGLYCNMYKMILEAINAIQHIENNSVLVAMNDYIRDKVQVMDSVLEAFKDR